MSTTTFDLVTMNGRFLVASFCAIDTWSKGYSSTSIHPQRHLSSSLIGNIPRLGQDPSKWFSQRESSTGSFSNPGLTLGLIILTETLFRVTTIGTI
ncbi:MAG: hypothetical protein CM15mV49_220 [uncultured marine virus]|nr:MAG: hypothetical protein CM15mV49_220 [uncultured marine virus]